MGRLSRLGFVCVAIQLVALAPPASYMTISGGHRLGSFESGKVPSEQYRDENQATLWCDDAWPGCKFDVENPTVACRVATRCVWFI